MKAHKTEQSQYKCSIGNNIAGELILSGSIKQVAVIQNILLQLLHVVT